ncbi:MAG: hypothetical protein DRP09_13500 [Candidatus Thorarchaeota archaeon]|nr:MAG: hypothetical protein DRP09_13500 [Candidatus Thorarchaeota archaeon]
MRTGTGDRIRLKGTVEIVLKGPDGRIKQHDVHHNLIVDAGFDIVNTLLRTGTGDYTSVLGLVWNDPDAATITLTSGNLDFQNYTNQSFKSGGDVTITRIDEKSWKLEATWGSGEPTPGGSGWPIPIRGIGVYYQALANKIFSGIVRAPLNKESIDDLVITYTFTMA